MKLTHIDLFAGVGGFSLGFERAGLQTVAHVEKDPQARQVLKYHWPDCILLDDVTTAGKHNLPYADVISFGSPCQDMSIAGKRKGLEGGRSGLFWEGIRIINELKPAFAVWENVPGALSSNAGRDFVNVLAAFRDIGARDICWTVLDSQYFRVAQRRRRVFVVADFTDRECAAEILFERESGAGHPQPRRTPGQGTARNAANSAECYRIQRSDGYTQDTIASTLSARDYKSATDLVSVVGALQARDYKGVGNQYVNENKLVVSGVATLGHTQSNGLGVYEQDIANTLEAVGSSNQAVIGTLAASGAGTARPAGQANEADFLVIDMQGGKGRAQVSKGIVPTLGAYSGAHVGQHAPLSEPIETTGHQGDTVIPCAGSVGHMPAQGGNNGGGAGALLLDTHAFQFNASSHDGLTIGNDITPVLRTDPLAVQQAAMVRRLTPLECERLQSFPDGWTAVDGMSDSARYRFMGNAVTVNVIEWLGRRIVKVLS